MPKKAFTLLILALSLIGSMAVTVFATRTANQTRTKAVDPLLTRIQQYSFPSEHNVVSGVSPKETLGLAGPTSKGPLGVYLGNTWYDSQRNGSMRRMVAWRNGPRVHFVWMRLTDSIFAARKCYYKCYNAATAQFDCEGGVPIADDEYAGYCVVNATGDDRGLICGHNNPAPTTGGVYAVQCWWDNVPGFCQFFTTCRPPDNLGSGCEYNIDYDHAIWPATCLEEGATDTFLHVFGQESREATAAPQPVAYFRQVSVGVWDQFYCVDTVYDIAEDCDCTNDGKVVIA